jgi:inositol transport system substrate-binding protein
MRRRAAPHHRTRRHVPACQAPSALFRVPLIEDWRLEMKKTLLMALTAAALITPLAASAQKIGVAMANSETFLAVLRNGMKDYAESKPGVSLQFTDAENDLAKQMDQIQNLVAQKVDALIVNPVDTDATTKITRMVVKAGIPLVYVNRMPAEKTLPPKVSFVGSNEVDSGTLQMTEVCKQMGGKGNILVMMGQLSNQAATQRTKDIEDVIAKPPCTGIKILQKQSANWLRVEGADLMSNWLSAGMQFDAVVANNDEMAIGAIQALKAANKLGKTMVAGIDATQDGLAAMKAGDLKVTVFQDAFGQGRGAVDTALKIVAGEKVESKVWIPFELVTPANLQTFLSKN